MAGLNDRSYGVGITLLSVSGSGGTLFVSQNPYINRRLVYADSGTMWVLGQSQGIGQTHAYALSLTTSFTIDGPAAFVLLATTNGGTIKVINFYSQSGIQSPTSAT